MKQKNRPFFFAIQSKFKNISDEINHKQQKYQFKPFGVVNDGFCRGGAKIIFYKSGNCHGYGKDTNEHCHRFGTVN